MGTMFPTMLDEFEQYNIKALPSYWTFKEEFDDDERNVNSFDENGELHSFNDKPARVIMQRGGKTELMWYNHGVLGREVGPVRCSVEDNVEETIYTTLNTKNNLHSYDDKPSSIHYHKRFKEFSLTWHKNQENHRDGDKPAEIEFSGQGVTLRRYRLHGDIHRGNNLPASIMRHFNSWKIFGFYHNGTGPASTNSLRDAARPEKYVLYGVPVPSETFNAINACRTENNVPLYAAFLHVLKVIPEEHLNIFKQEDYIIPMTWAFRYWGLTEKSVYEKIEKFNEPIPRCPLATMIKISTFEEQALAANLNHKESINV